MVGVAVKVTFAPAHTLGVVVEMLNDGVNNGFTTITAGAEVAKFGLEHELLDVTIQRTVSLLFNVEEIN